MLSRFTRELQNLKKMADYSSRDTGNLNAFLQNIGAEYSIYTYSMLNAGVDKDSFRSLTEDQLLKECGINNSIHRHRIFSHIKGKGEILHVSMYSNSISKVILSKMYWHCKQILPHQTALMA